MLTLPRDWRHTLAEAAEKLEQLEAEAQSLGNSEGRYIRPIAVFECSALARINATPNASTPSTCAST